MSAPEPLPDFTAFEDQVGTVFTTDLDEQHVQLELVEATNRTPDGYPGQQFSLLFQGPTDPALSQSIVSLEHDTLGSLDLFLVPVGIDTAGRQYEAFFNRIDDAA